MAASERALEYVRRAGRLQTLHLKDNFGARVPGRLVTKNHNQGGHTIGTLQRSAKPPLGWIWGNFYGPWQRMFPGEPHFNADIHLRKEYIPISLLELSRLIDLGWLDPALPVDLSALTNTKRVHVDPLNAQWGVQLTDEGADVFSYPLDIEVQWASDTAIAAVERVGGRIRTAYYDAVSLEAAIDPESWFKAGKAIPVRRAPPQQLLSYYKNPENRGYLASQFELTEARRALSLRMGYSLPEEVPRGELRTPHQVFVGLPPGGVVSLVDKKLFRSTHPALVRHYERLLADPVN